jgi:hypothetical protein
VSRNGNDLTERFANVARALSQRIKTPTACSTARSARSDERALELLRDAAGQRRRSSTTSSTSRGRGEPLVDLPLEERRASSPAARPPEPDRAPLRGLRRRAALLDSAARSRPRGVDRQEGGSRYEPGRRTRNWLKVKTHGRQEFIIAGYTRGKGRRSRTSARSCSPSPREGLEYVGNVGTGFTRRRSRSCSQARPLERKTRRSRRPEDAEGRRATSSGSSRSSSARSSSRVDARRPAARAVVQGLREDKEARRCAASEPIETEIRRASASSSSRTSTRSSSRRGHHEGRPARLLPRRRAGARPAPEGPAVHDEALPRRARRQLLLPEGRAEAHAEWIDAKAFTATTRRSRQKRMITYPLVNDELALLWMVNMGCIDMNAGTRASTSRAARLRALRPRPVADVGFRRSSGRAARQGGPRRARLEGYPKTSGVRRDARARPDRAAHTYDDTREFARSSPKRSSGTHRGLVTTEWSKAKRRGVLIDANQNGEGRRSPRSTRATAREARPVSTRSAGTR